jgi:uncharacterized protein
MRKIRKQILFIRRACRGATPPLQHAYSKRPATKTGAAKG